MTRSAFLTTLTLMQFVLASQSPYRKAQLEGFSLPFEAVKPAVDEEELKQSGPQDLVELTRFLAFHKADSVRAKFPNAVILGSDQLVELDGERLDKPGNMERAHQQLKKLQGRSHSLITSLSVLSPTASYTFTDITLIFMRELSDAEIDSYLTVDKPFDCAGSYKIEKAGLALIERIEGKDPSAIQGLPLISLNLAFQKLGIPLKEVWGLKK